MRADEWADLAIGRRAQCWSCQRAPGQEDLRLYDHPDGWRVDGFPERQWLFFECSGCGFQTSFAVLKIGKL